MKWTADQYRWVEYEYLDSTTCSIYVVPGHAPTAGALPESNNTGGVSKGAPVLKRVMAHLEKHQRATVEEIMAALDLEKRHVKTVLSHNKNIFNVDNPLSRNPQWFLRKNETGIVIAELNKRFTDYLERRDHGHSR